MCNFPLRIVPQFLVFCHIIFYYFCWHITIHCMAFQANKMIILEVCYQQIALKKTVIIQITALGF